MNTKNLQQIFANYIDNFDVMNDIPHDETFKWWAAYRFRELMDEALQAPIDQFADLLDAIKGHQKKRSRCRNYHRGADAPLYRIGTTGQRI